jgi:hypothetical protein
LCRQSASWSRAVHNALSSTTAAVPESSVPSLGSRLPEQFAARGGQTIAAGRQAGMVSQCDSQSVGSLGKACTVHCGLRT